MSESENMKLNEEDQENQFSIHEDQNPSSENDLEEESVNKIDPSDSSGEEIEKGHHHKKKEGKDIYQVHLENFLKEFQEESNLEQKLQLAIDFMEKALSQGGTPHFRNFWEARRHCLPLFKENVSPTMRTQLWNRYSELSKEARRLKDILDEQSAFAVEQIEIAIKALEQEIEQFDNQPPRGGFGTELIFPHALKAKRAFYEDLQRQLNLLNAQASRINALRKELLKTEMRVRHKNKFFQRLSLAGDKVFPRRKELIKQISLQFIEDINEFIKSHFTNNLDNDSALYVLREDIKALQGLAKVLTLNTNAFTQTRMRLSECWDQIKIKEKERKKERAQQKVAFKQNAEEVHQMIVSFKEQFEKEALSVHDANKKIDEIVAYMRKIELGRDELRVLREELNEARKPLQDKLRAEEEVKQQQEQERGRQKREKYHLLKSQVEALLNDNEGLDADQLIAERDGLLTQIADSTLTKNEKQEIERLLKPLKDTITEKHEKALLNLSEDDRQNLKQLQDILNQRKSRRQEIKIQLETLRKTTGSSSLDFEKAMSINALISEEKERLDKINLGIKEIEVKISQLQSKIRSNK